MGDKPKAVAKKREVKNHGIKISFAEPLEVLQSGMSSVELKRNAKGITEIITKVYASNAKDAMDDASKIYKNLDKQFPTD